MEYQPQSAGGADRPRAQLSHLFATPVLRAFWSESEALNAELRRVILDKMAESPGVVKTNRGGWHSKGDLHLWPEACMRAFVTRLEAAVRELVEQTVPDADQGHWSGWQIEAWANVNPKGAFNKAHHHVGTGNVWSGFYYVDTGADDSQNEVGGHTVLLDRSGTPRAILKTPNPASGEVRIVPQAGLMVIFPAGLYHSVEPYRGERLRITIAFNLRHPSFMIPSFDGKQARSWWWRNFRGIMLMGQRSAYLLRGLVQLPAALSARTAPRTLRLKPWWNHIRTALARAMAEAQEAAEHKDAEGASR